MSLESWQTAIARKKLGSLKTVEQPEAIGKMLKVNNILLRPFLNKKEKVGRELHSCIKAVLGKYFNVKQK
jgi:hypothetical protein